MRGVVWLDAIFRFTVLPMLMLWSGRELARNIRLLLRDLLEGGGYRW